MEPAFVRSGWPAPSRQMFALMASDNKSDSVPTLLLIQNIQGLVEIADSVFEFLPVASDTWAFWQPRLSTVAPATLGCVI